MSRILVGATLVAIVLFVSLGPSPARAEPSTYDLVIKLKAVTVDGMKIKVVATGTMTYDPATGEVSFDVMESDAVDWHITGTGLLGKGDKVAIARTSFEASPLAGGEPFYTGSAFFIGKFKKGDEKFSGKFYAVADSFGEAPEGFTFNAGKMKAVRQ